MNDISEKSVIIKINMFDGKYNLKTIVSSNIDKSDLMECVFSIVNFAKTTFGMTEDELISTFTAILLCIFTEKNQLENLMRIIRNKNETN